MSENGEIYTAGKNFALPPALTAWTNSTSEFTGNQTHNYVLTGFKIVQGTSDWRHRGGDKSFYSFWTTSSFG